MPSVLHKLAGVVLVRVRLTVLRVVEIQQHRAVFRDLVGQIGIVAERIAREEVVLVHHHLWRDAVLAQTAREMIAPEVDHALAQRVLRLQAAIDPPHLRGEIGALALLRVGRGAEVERDIAIGLIWKRIRSEVDQPLDRWLHARGGNGRDLGIGSAEASAPQACLQTRSPGAEQRRRGQRPAP